MTGVYSEASLKSFCFVWGFHKIEHWTVGEVAALPSAIFIFAILIDRGLSRILPWLGLGFKLGGGYLEKISLSRLIFRRNQYIVRSP